MSAPEGPAARAEAFVHAIVWGEHTTIWELLSPTGRSAALSVAVGNGLDRVVASRIEGDVANPVELEDFLRQLGPALATDQLELDPVERGWYEHLEYAPLVNARAHRLGGRLRIANSSFEGQYRRFLDRLAHIDSLGDAEWLEVAYYQLLADRVADGLAAYERVSADSSGVQLDYLKAYAALTTSAARGAVRDLSQLSS